MQFTPHDYQKQSIDHMISHPRSILFLGMGFGKTVCTLSAIQQRRRAGQIGKTLVVAPLRVAQSVWAPEAQKWDHLQDLRFSHVLGTEKQRRAALAKEADVYVVNRENIPWLVERQESCWPYDMVVVDELSSFRSPDSKRFKALASVVFQSPFFVGLTGTPMPNGPNNLWAQVYLADGGARLGRNYGAFLEHWFWPCGPHDRPWITYSWKPKHGAQGEILRRIRDICLSITPPPGIAPESRSIIRPVQLPKEARALYDEFEEKLVLKLEDAELSAADQAPLLSKLQQFAGGAVYTTDTNHWKVFHDEKLQELQELVEAAGGEPILCFYQFRHEAVRIHEAFPQSRSIASAGAIDDWNRGSIPLLLAHPASSGHGLNLQLGGSIIVWFGLTFDAELYQQANARLVRQGQKQLVRIYHIIAEKTRDEDILPVLEGKTLSQDAMIRALVRRKQLV